MHATFRQCTPDAQMQHQTANSSSLDIPAQCPLTAKRTHPHKVLENRYFRLRPGVRLKHRPQQPHNLSSHIRLNVRP
jgi:hypothetical protein